MSKAVLTAPLERSTCPYQGSLLSLSMRSRSSMPSHANSSVDLMVAVSCDLTLQICPIIALSSGGRALLLAKFHRHGALRFTRTSCTRVQHNISLYIENQENKTEVPEVVTLCKKWRPNMELYPYTLICKCILTAHFYLVVYFPVWFLFCLGNAQEAKSWPAKLVVWVLTPLEAEIFPTINAVPLLTTWHHHPSA